MPRREDFVIVPDRFRGSELADSPQPAKLRTATFRIQTNDRVSKLISAIDSGRVKGKLFSKAIEDFSPEELGRLADELLVYYKKKFS
jgi:hypothetical protein